MQAHKNYMLRSMIKSIEKGSRVASPPPCQDKHTQPVIQAAQAQATSYTSNPRAENKQPISADNKKQLLWTSNIY